MPWPTVTTVRSLPRRLWRSTIAAPLRRTLYADGHNYVASPRWVLFGHHFAAIAGAGSAGGTNSGGAVRVSRPAFLWLLIGAVLAGCVQDFTVLVASVRHRGRSLADVARTEISPFAGLVAMICRALYSSGDARRPRHRRRQCAFANSPWGVFTIGMTIPIAVIMGLWMFKSHAGKITVTGPSIFRRRPFNRQQWSPGTGWRRAGLQRLLPSRPIRSRSSWRSTGLVASVLPVWLVLEPRDYLSTYVKLGTIAATGHRRLCGSSQHSNFRTSPRSFMAAARSSKASLFPFLFVTIACGAISGFHSLVSSGTTPKMLDKESRTLASSDTVP
jgi:carbon starvation protein